MTVDTPYMNIGVNYSVPLNFNSVNDIKEANYKMENAVKLAYKHQALSEKITWEQMVEGLAKAQNRLKLTRDIERLQDEKLQHEIRRWKSGVSTTYQILQFENDLTRSSLNSLSTANEIISIIADLKMYKEEE
jgi:outer membrane protein TolC